MANFYKSHIEENNSVQPYNNKFQCSIFYPQDIFCHGKRTLSVFAERTPKRISLCPTDRLMAYVGAHGPLIKQSIQPISVRGTLNAASL